MAVVLALAAVVLVDRFGDRLDRTTEADLRLRGADVAALVAEARRAGDRPPLDASAGRVQVLDLRNRVVAGSPELRDRSVLTPRELQAASVREVRLERGPDGGVLLLARPAGAGRVAVVGVDRARRAEAKRALGGLVLAGAPLLLGLAVAAGYGVSFFALRPVEAMRRRAAEVTARDPTVRLPLPPADDELRALGSTLNGMLDRLQDGLERERALVADASHELRTPLAVAQAEVELALRPGRTAGELGEALRSVGDELDRLTRLSEDLLLLARADREELRLERRRVPVADLLAEAGARMRRAYGAGVGVEVEPGAADEVDADPARVEQALANLVANAFRYGAEHVRIRAAAHGRDAVRVHVSDDGPGFDPEFLPRAFARFARAPGESRASGSGLGLAIVAAIARAHGGDAGARNLERGADVWIALPRSGADQAGPSSTGTTSTGTRL